MERLKPDFPEVRILFTPEVPPKTSLLDIPTEILEISDGFICEYRFLGASIEENTAELIRRLREIRDFIDHTAKPVFLAHPFRDSINFRLVKRQIEPWVTALESRPSCDFSPSELAEFFLLDIEKIGEVTASIKVPLEINGSTEQRTRASNLPAALQMLRATYRIFRDKGVSLVPGSDQHSYSDAGIGRMGAYVPYDTFEFLQMTVDDIDYAKPFLQQLA